MIFQFEEVKRGISIHHLLGIGFFKSLLSIDPLLMKLGQVGQERSDLRPPSSCKTTEELF
jgi:hypothetical protein